MRYRVNPGRMLKRRYIPRAGDVEYIGILTEKLKYPKQSAFVADVKLSVFYCGKIWLTKQSYKNHISIPESASKQYSFYFSGAALWEPLL